MTNDGSIASKVEEWAVTTLTTADTGSVMREIAQYEGNLSDGGSRAIETIKASRQPVIRVMVARGNNLQQTENRGRRFYDLHVFVGVSNERGGVTARCGDGEQVGLHGIVELVDAALDGSEPAQLNAATTQTSTRLRFKNWGVVWEQMGCYLADVVFEYEVVGLPG